MSSSTLQHDPRLSPSIRALLASLRTGVQRYVWTEGIACGAAWLGAAFWISIAVDWFFEPPVPLRVVMLLGIAAVLFALVVKYIVRRAFVRLSDGNMATVLERRFPQLGDSLLTAVLLAERDPSHEGYDPEMFDRTCVEAVKRIQNLHINDVFNFQPLRRQILAASLLAVSVLLFGIIAPQSFRVWAGRMLGLSEAPWPRLCKIEAEGFVQGMRKIARGSDVEIVIRALPGPNGNFVIPSSVEIRYREEGRSRSRWTSMDKVGSADPEKDSFQEYTYTRRNVLTPISFDVRGGDASLGGLKVEVVESPTISKWTLDCEYPAYMGREKRSLPVTSVMQLPQGSKATIRAAANKPLDRVQIDRVSDEVKIGQPIVLDDQQLSADRREFAFVVPSLDKDTTLLFTLFDMDGIKSHEAIRLGLAAVGDQAPQVAAQLDGIGSAITAKARVAVTGRATDDYGIGKMWFEYGIEQQPPSNAVIGTPATTPAEAPAEINLEGQALDVEKLDLKPGKKFLVALKVSDLCSLSTTGSNVGTGEQWTLDIVTPEQLRALLEGRELVLRQRFESIMREMTETRDLLVRAKWDSPTKPASTSDAPKSDNTNDNKGGDDKKVAKSSESGENIKGRSDGKTKRSPSADEPGDETPVKGQASSAEHQIELLMLRVQSASTNCLKSTQETLGLADSFEEIRKELVNNRVDTEELRERLQAGIADPLRRIAVDMLPELDRRLQKLQVVLEASRFEPELRDAAKTQAEAVLLAMQKVLDRMIELEDYNQMVELLRDVIKMQEQLRNQTEQRQKQKIRDLLKE